MVRVNCPKTGKEEWANLSGKGKEVDPKCCKCGLRHKPVKGLTQA